MCVAHTHIHTHIHTYEDKLQTTTIFSPHNPLTTFHDIRFGWKLKFPPPSTKQMEPPS